jgi:phasin family protein
MPTDTENQSVATTTHATRADLRALLDKLKLPGIDTKKLLESGRKDIEALIETNDKAFVAVEALTRKQVEMLSEMAKEWQASIKDSVSAAGGTEKLTQASAHAQRAFASALTSMKEMAEIAAKSNHEVLGILNKRFHEGLEELRSSIRKGSAPKDANS